MRLVLALAVLLAPPLTAAPVKVACVGDSITLGVGVRDPARESYPAVLGQLLGRKYEVENFGFSGATLLRKGNNPYEKTAACRGAKRFKPDIVIIALGTNDSKTRNWDGRGDEFLADYKTLIAGFTELANKPKIFVCLPPPSFQSHEDDIRERILVRQRATIRKLAAKARLGIIDFDAALRPHPHWLPDGVHPNAAGARALALQAEKAVRK